MQANATPKSSLPVQNRKQNTANSVHLRTKLVGATISAAVPKRKGKQ